MSKCVKTDYAACDRRAGGAANPALDAGYRRRAMIRGSRIAGPLKQVLSRLKPATPSSGDRELPLTDVLRSARPRRRSGGVPQLNALTMSFLGFAVGVVAGVGAFIFRQLIGLVHNLLFLRHFAFAYDASRFTPASPWGPFVILVPVVGGVLVTFLVTNFAPEAKGHGVPEVMDAIHHKGGVIRPAVAFVKSIASAIAIGSGAAVGREGPIIQIGSSFGSTLGQIIKMRPAQRVTLIAAGAGAGIAATFNTPIGGVLFAIELLLPEISANTFLPVAIATGTATFIGRLFFGPQPAFYVPSIAPMPANPHLAAAALVMYLLLGLLAGAASAGFIRGLHLVEDLFDRIKGDYIRHMLGMLAVGLLMYGLYRGFGQYYVDGVGYATIQSILTGGFASLGWLLALLLVSKLAATSVSLGSGSSGGVFSPSLFMGATLGGAFAVVGSILFPDLGIHVPSFAMVGMGAMVGGATGAVMTAVAMIFEMTRDYGIVLPMIIAVAAAQGVRRILSPESIYTLKLARRGRTVPQELRADVFHSKRAKDIMFHDFTVEPAETRLSEFLARAHHGGAMAHVVVARGNRIVGVLRINTALRRGVADVDDQDTLGDIAQQDFTIVRDDDTCDAVIYRLWRRRARMALVFSGKGSLRQPRPDHVLGVITKEHIADAAAGSIVA